MSDNLRIFGLNYSNIDGIKAYDTNGNEITYTRQSAPTPAGDNPVKFIDYDGTVLYSYSVSDFLALTAMPANPSHTGLIAQGWNWSLSDAQDYMEDYPEAVLTVGQMYTTASGATEIDIELEEAGLSPYLRIAVNGTLIVDWGDNTTQTVTGTSLTTTISRVHAYSQPGAYTIKLSASSGSYALYSATTYASLISANQTTSSGQINNYFYTSCVKAARIGNDVSSMSCAFHSCFYLEYVTIPNTITNVGGYSFSGCSRLKSVTIPNSATSIPGRCFYDCREIELVSVPNGITTIDSYAFYNCYSLKYFTFPKALTTTGENMFEYSGLTSILLPDGIPGFSRSYAFASCDYVTSIRLPADLTDFVSTYAFQGLDSLKSITIPASVTNIPSRTFSGCYSVKSIRMLGTTVPTLDSVAFDYIRFDYGARIYVPASALTDYQTATNWSAYASYMIGV